MENQEFKGFKYMIKTYYHSYPEQLYKIIDTIKGSDLDAKDKDYLIAYATAFIDGHDNEETLDEAKKAKEVNLDDIDPFDLVMDTIAYTGREAMKVDPKTGKSSPRNYRGLYDYDETYVTADGNIQVVIDDEERIDKGVEFAKKYDIVYKKNYRPGSKKWVLTLDPWTVDVEKLYPDRDQFITTGLYKKGGEHKKKAKAETFVED